MTLKERQHTADDLKPDAVLPVQLYAELERGVVIVTSGEHA